ncbi:hypothetical protein ACFL22_00365 [Patescibacteria group bacterium]
MVDFFQECWWVPLSFFVSAVICGILAFLTEKQIDKGFLVAFGAVIPLYVLMFIDTGHENFITNFNMYDFVALVVLLNIAPRTEDLLIQLRWRRNAKLLFGDLW